MDEDRIETGSIVYNPDDDYYRLFKPLKYNWELDVFGNGYWGFKFENAPNIFWRTAQRLIFGFKWKKLN